MGLPHFPFCRGAVLHRQGHRVPEIGKREDVYKRQAQAVDEVQIAVQQAVAQLVIQAAANGDLHVGPLLVELPDGG